MFATIMNAVLRHGKLKTIVITGAMLAGLGVPTAAFADHRDHDRDRHEHPGFRVDVQIPFPRIFVPEPAYQPPCPAPVVTNQVWVPAVYQTVEEKVWVPDVTTTQIQRVEVPAEYGYRDVVRVDFFGCRHIYREQVLIRPARCEERQVTVVVTPAHFECQTHRQLVCEGHWETRVCEVR